MRKLNRSSTKQLPPTDWVGVRLRGSPYWWNGFAFTQSIVVHPKYLISTLLVHFRNVYHLDVEMVDIRHIKEEDKRFNLDRPITYKQYSRVDDDDDD